MKRRDDYTAVEVYYYRIISDLWLTKHFSLTTKSHNSIQSETTARIFNPRAILLNLTNYIAIPLSDWWTGVLYRPLRS
jgi:hypothetical protein